MDKWEIYSRAVEQYRAENFDAALKLVDELKRIAPDFRKAYTLEVCVWNDLGNAVKELAVLEKLLPMFDLSVREDRDFAADALARMGKALSSLTMPEEALKFFLTASQIASDDRDACLKVSGAIFAACGIENFSAEDFRALYSDYKKHLTNVAPFPKKFYNHDKIRVGYLSANFNMHPVMNWSWSLINGLDKNSFQVHCYSTVDKCDAVTNFLKGRVDCWREIFSLTDAQAAEVIRNDEIDILIDLAGHTPDNRLPIAAYRPAPIQISGVGYMNSTGLDCFDYFLSDVHLAGNSTAYFTEKILALPRSHVCYEPARVFEISELPCLSKGFVTFGNFNNSCKFTDTIFRAWKKILDAVPKSRLLLKTKIFNASDCRNFVSERLKNLGFDTSRIEMRGFTANHLAEYADVDIALDTFPYTGGVTTCEALYMGVPVVSLFGERHGTRFGLSILKNIGLDVLAVDNLDDYVKRAVMLAGDWELLDDLRRNLRAMMTRSPLMDSTNYVRDVEAAFKKILRDECGNEAFWHVEERRA